jgi:oxygen-independent coproporphyrinogen-3 oxidase
VSRAATPAPAPSPLDGLRAFGPRADRPPDASDLARALELAARYDRPGPRYTSYPPAPHFTEAVGPEAAAETYAARGPGAPPLSLYLHLPFCESMCTYCACNVVISKDYRIVARYLRGLEKEVALAAKALAAGGGPTEVAQLHLGGGTPTFFRPDDLRRLHGVLSSRFPLRPDAEVAIEVDPRVTTREHVETLASLGWRRMSLGVQDFDERVQEAVHRVQSREATAELVATARGAGFTSVNVDLMYGLPHQTLDGFRRTLDAVASDLRPDRVSLFGYAHVPWLKAHQRRIDPATLPAPEARLALFHAGVRAFVSAGYEFIGLDHFARPGDELATGRRTGDLHRNFMGFHTAAGTDMVAFGITGIGDTGGVYLQNRHKIPEWERELDAGRLPVQRGYRRTEDDRRRGAVIQSLMCLGRVSPETLGAGEGAPWRARWAPELERLAPMAADGIVVVSDEGLRLTPLGRLFVRNVCMVFDAHLGKAPPSEKRAGPRYSRTV